jgi:hypothetical protein
MGIGFAVGRTPRHEQYRKRAERHMKISPQQALVDLTTAIEAAPKKQKAALFRRRSDLYAQMGRRLEALDDLTTYSQSDGAHAGARGAAEVTGIPLDSFAEGWTQGTISGMQRDLARDGQLVAIGYCRRCKDVKDAAEKGKRCVVCGAKLKDARYVRPGERAAEARNLLAVTRRRRTRRLVTLAIAVVGTVAAVLICSYSGVFEPRTRRSPSPAAPSATPAPSAVPSGPATFVSFSEDVFSFEYPSDWTPITEDEIPILLAGALEGMDESQARYIGGVWTGGLVDCAGCAQIVLVVMEQKGMQGPLTEEQYQNYRDATEQRMGSRLISTRYATVGGLPGAEAIHVGASQRTKLWDLIVLPPEPGLIYSMSCTALKDEYEQFEGVFAHAYATMRFAGVEAPDEAAAATVEAPPATQQAPSEPTLDLSACQLGAIFQADVTIPDGARLVAGEEFVKTWRVRNTGSCPWGDGYHLSFVDGDQMGAPDSVPLTEAPPGSDVEISLSLVAPAQAGRARGAWQICVVGGECFGDRLTVLIEVTE